MTEQGPTSPPATRERFAVRWWLAVLSVGLGVLVLVAAGLVAHNLTWLRSEGAAFWSGLAVNVGTSLLLAAALIGLERVIVKKVREDRQAAVTQAAEIAAESAAQKTAAAFRPQLDDLDQRIRERSSSRIEDAVEAAQRVADLGTFDSVRDALAEAARIDAIGKKRSGDGWSTMAWEIIVPAGETITSPRMSVTYEHLIPGGGEAVSLSVVSYRENSSVTWHPDRTPEEVFDQLREALVATGLAWLGQQMSAEALFKNLAAALRDALLSRRAAAEAWHSAASVIEYISDSCVMTVEGIELRDPEFYINASSFGVYDDEGDVYGQSFPQRPETVDPELWQELLNRGGIHYPKPDPDLW